MGSGGVIAAALIATCLPPATALAGSAPAATDAGAALRRLVERGQLEVSGRRREELRRFYSARGWSPAFLREGEPTPQARIVAGTLADAGRKGLDPEDYLGSRWGDWLAGVGAGGPEQQARFDVSLAAAAMRYASDLHRGRVDPRRFGHPLAPLHGPVDLVAVALELARSPEPGAVLDGLEPDVDHYRWLLSALTRTREAERALRREKPLALPRRIVEAGGAYPDAPGLARRLAALGDLPAPLPLCLPVSSLEVEVAREAGADEPPGTLTPALSAGLSRFQARHRLPPDGRLGRRTADALNVPLSFRVRQIELALERWRWLPDEFPEPPIVVNIPEYRLLAFVDGGGRLTEALAMDVIVGQDDERRRTPLMARRIGQVVFAPFWEVPRKLAEEELLPRIESQPGFGERNGFLVEGPAGARPADAEGLQLVRQGSARLRQRPGPQNSLGRVKFPLDAGDVYLHDTPARKLFSRQVRALSHGCVRLAAPAALAAHVLRDRPEWTRERIEEAMAAEQPTYVPLENGPMVYAMYATASAGPDGQPRFAEDVYGLDRKLAAALERDRKRAPLPGLGGGPVRTSARLSR